MLMIESAVTEARRLPTLVKVGLVALGLSSIADLIGHIDAGLVIAPIGQVHEFSPAETTAHLAVVVSMVLVLVGVVVDGVRRSRVRRPSVWRGQKGVA